MQQKNTIHAVVPFTISCAPTPFQGGVFALPMVSCIILNFQYLVAISTHIGICPERFTTSALCRSLSPNQYSSVNSGPSSVTHTNTCTFRWLRRVYPGQPRLETLVPASMVSMDIIASCAGKGEILPVCFTEGGLHTDLALFLGSEVLPIAAAENKGSILAQQRSKERLGVVGSGGGLGPDGFVTVGVDLQSSTTTIILKPGFRLILFETSTSSSSSSSSSPSSTSSPPSSLIFLQDSPDALAGVQLIRFGGVDSVGVVAADDGTGCLENNANDTKNSSAQDVERALTSSSSEKSSSDSSSDASDDSSSTESKEAEDIPVPSFVLAGMGLIRQPGFEMSKTIGARLREEIARAFPRELGSGEETGQQALGESMATIVTTQREALAYSGQLGATHEAVIALLAARPPCFEPDLPRFAPDITVPPGGEPTTGVSDDVERDQNRVLNNLIETLFAYKTTLEKGVDTVAKCDRASQEKIAMTARKAEQLANRLASSTLRFLARCGDMLHVWGSDPALYSPVFPGVRALVHGVIRRVAHATEAPNPDEAVLERNILSNLTRSMVTRVADECEWIVPLAALAINSPGDLPANGWWDTAVALLADRHSGVDGTEGVPSRLTLGKLFRMVVVAGARTGGGLVPLNHMLDHSPADDKDSRETSTEAVCKNKVMLEGMALVRAVVGPWLEHHEPEVPRLPSDEDVASEDSANEAGDDESSRHGIILSPQRWDLGFDTSGWVRDRGATAVAALTRDRGLPFDINGRRGGEQENNSFFIALSQLWTAAKTDRAMMNAMQAEEARPFSGDDMLYRLVFLEVTMNFIFARLPGYVMCEASRWLQWIAEVRRSLSVVEGGSDSSSIGSLRYLLSHPPPAFVAKSKVSDDISSSFSSSQDGSSNSGSDSGEDGDNNAKSTKGQPIVEERSRESSDLSYTNGDSQSLAVAGDVKPVETLGGEGAGHSKVRRDSRERMKIKLGLLDGLGMAVAGGENGNNDSSAEAKMEFNARARSLFGVSTSTARGVISARNPSSSSSAVAAAGSSTAANDSALPGSGPAGQGSKPPTSTKLVGRSVSVNGHEEENADEEEECKFITFVAESFRPQRDNSDWHKEAKPAPPRRNVSADATSTADLVMAGQKVTDSAKDETIDVADTASSADETISVAKNTAVDEGHKDGETQQIAPAVASLVTPLWDSGSEPEAPTGSRASFETGEQRRVKPDSSIKNELAALSDEAFGRGAPR